MKTENVHDRKSLVIVQRVLTPYRLELFTLLSKYYHIKIITSQGDKIGSLKLAKIDKVVNRNRNLEVKVLRSLRLAYKGESRSTSLFFYPQSFFHLFSSDVLILEGATNLINNLYLVPLAKVFGKKVVWWDAGYSPEIRAKRRKLIDFIAGSLIRLTDLQFAYSTKALNYMRSFMNAKNCVLLLNTINTEFFEKNQSRINQSLADYSFDRKSIRLLYVGAIEKRKGISDLIDMIHSLNSATDQEFYLNAIGGGNELKNLKEKLEKEEIGKINLVGPIYNKEELMKYYMNADFFILPGDGGLAIVQSIMFNLPVLCLKADGTEFDYLDREMIFNSLSDIKSYLSNVTKPYKGRIVELKFKLFSTNWVEGFRHHIATIT